jgi:hypothetical protein
MLLIVAFCFFGITAEALDIQARPAAAISQANIPDASTVLGSDPWRDRAGRILPGRTSFVLQKELIARTQGFKSKKWVTVRFCPGYIFAVLPDTGEVDYIVQCGNPIRATDGSKIRIILQQSEEQPVQRECLVSQVEAEPQAYAQQSVQRQSVYRQESKFDHYNRLVGDSLLTVTGSNFRHGDDDLGWWTLGGAIVSRIISTSRGQKYNGESLLEDGIRGGIGYAASSDSEEDIVYINSDSDDGSDGDGGN